MDRWSMVARCCPGGRLGTSRKGRFDEAGRVGWQHEYRVVIGKKGAFDVENVR